MNFEAMNSHAPSWMIAGLNLLSGFNGKKIKGGASGPTLKIEAMNGYANLLRGREVPAGYRGAALIRDVLGCRHGVAVLQNISCPSLWSVRRTGTVSKGFPLWHMGCRQTR